MSRQIVMPKNEQIVIRIPKEYINQQTEILVRPLGYDKTQEDFTIASAYEDIDRLSWNMGGKKYTRDDLYER